MPDLCVRRLTIVRATKANLFARKSIRRDGRAAEGARLESVLSRKGYGGSNPSLSAMNHSLCPVGFMPCTGGVNEVHDDWYRAKLRFMAQPLHIMSEPMFQHEKTDTVRYCL